MVKVYLKYTSSILRHSWNSSSVIYHIKVSQKHVRINIHQNVTIIVCCCLPLQLNESVLWTRWMTSSIAWKVKAETFGPWWKNCEMFATFWKSLFRTCRQHRASEEREMLFNYEAISKENSYSLSSYDFIIITIPMAIERLSMHF